MGIASFFVFIFLSHLLLIHSAEADDNNLLPICPDSFQCGNHSPISYPFTSNNYPQCGFVVDCDQPVPKVHLGKQYPPYDDVFYINDSTVEIHDPLLEFHKSRGICNETFKNLSLPHLEFISLEILNNLTFFKCNNNTPPDNLTHHYFSPDKYISYEGCTPYSLYYSYPDDEPTSGNLPHQCEVIQLPALWPPTHHPNDGDPPFPLLTATFHLKFHISNGYCLKCKFKGGTCQSINQTFQCHDPQPKVPLNVKKKGKKRLGWILGTAISGFAALTLLIFIIWRRYKGKYVFSYFLSRNISSDPSSRADLEGGSFFGVPVFSYTELEEATNNFDPKHELGDGGFGTVYHGKLRDGRDVAVKRLYEHNYKRVEQFKNEIEILTRLRHKNLVTLYGCTSRHSRELLLVYEYIPNGTVADHLHGDLAKPGSLPWSIRINIAIETATALAYLHASDIIHRDVKTNNILLDNNFCVKVADFGLSRLFPIDVTHVSTAPQGTPGYVDPEYHQCYQLTDKSDVYSFGVVLIELVSSLPAVDIGRHRQEINLANFALNRIQNCAFNELVDPYLGFESDGVAQTMTTSVAELAFQCLQYDRDMRPTMEDVLEALLQIQGQECKDEKTQKVIDNVGVLKSRGPPPSPESDDAVLLKSKEQLRSPVSVTDSWVSNLSHPTQESDEAFLHSAKKI